MPTTVSKEVRGHGWNVYSTIGDKEGKPPFAGIYQVAGSNFLTFRDVCNELRLCFEYPTKSNDDYIWANVAFVLADRPDLSPEVRDLSFVHGGLLDRPVPSLPPLNPKEQDVLIYHFVFHQTCNLPSSELSAHLEGGCAQHLPEPTRRYDRRYLPPNEGSSNPAIAGEIWRQRSRSGSVSSTESLDNDHSTEAIGMLPPRRLCADEDETRETIRNFRNKCFASRTCCAVSHQGEPWAHQPLGLAIQACHIIPHVQYHLYPVGAPCEENDGLLLTAWQNTWNASNGILLRTDLHELFNARLFSIHPVTKKIRIFVPYDMLLPYHGKVADLPGKTDMVALRQHYEMCCIENMSAMYW